MKTLLAVALIAIAAPVAAQTTPAPTPAPETKTPAPATAAAKYTLETPIETIMADPKGKDVLTKDLGGDPSAHPMYDSFKSMSLKDVAPMSQGAITDEILKKVETDLAAIK